MIKKIAIVVLVVLVGFLAWKYFGSAKTATIQPTGKNIAAADITISNFSFSPSSFSAKAGQKVNVLNNDPTQHSLISDDGTFDTGLLSSGQQGSFTAPAKPGTYQYHCSIHTTMTGTLIVQ
jgi:plastocyanin